ncbi:hypothetical protein BH20ACI1_BH20ACI1_03250 [soil metagenome]
MNDSHLSKIPQITLLFWIMKICATTFGETGGDLLAQTLNVGYGVSSLILIGFFFVTLLFQFFSKKYNPLIYWLVIVATSTAGTTMSDYMDRTLGLGYMTGSLILVGILIAVLTFWRFTVGSLSVENIKTFRVESLYWTAILFSNTLGTALGDFLADDSGLGFGGGAALITGLLLLVILAHFYTKISKVILFWIAFVLTRPFGATFGDLLTKSGEKGGYDFGTISSSLILAAILVVLIIYSTAKENRVNNLATA